MQNRSSHSPISTAPGSAFANTLSPTTGEVQTYVATTGIRGPTVINFTNANGSYRWFIDEFGTASLIEFPVDLVAPTLTDNTDGNGLDDGTIVHNNGVGTIVVIDLCAAYRACVDPIQITSIANFADDELPTLIEAQAVATALPEGGPTVIRYTSPLGKDWRWFVDVNKTATLVKEPVIATAATLEIIEHTQSVAAATWSIVHAQGKDPVMVQLFDANRDQISATMTTPDLNTVQFDFATAQTGYAALLFKV